MTVVNPLTLIPANVRKWIYFGLASVVILLLATIAGFVAVQVAVPVWITALLAGVSSVGTAVGLPIAGSNVSDYETETPTEDDFSVEGTEGVVE